MSDIQEVKKALIAVMDSCVEGRTGEWNCTTEEGREGFEAMLDDLQTVADHFGIDTSTAKWHNQED